jgi:hypothetical protein
MHERGRVMEKEWCQRVRRCGIGQRLGKRISTETWERDKKQ